MPALRTTTLRTFLAMLCVALTAVLVAQSAIAIVSQVQHSQMADHPAVAFGGGVHLENDDHDDHHQAGHVAAQLSAADDVSTNGASHHHHGDGPQIAAMPREDATLIILTQALSLSGASDASPSSGVICGLKRPPRAALEVIA